MLMFESLSEFNNIVVSGPQRSGTRIATEIISLDTGKSHIDEKDINFHDFRLLEYYLLKGNVVIQCPGLCHLLHTIQGSDTLIIVIRRPIHEIILSENRKWSDQARKVELFKYGYSEGVISRVKYAFWESFQKPTLGERAREINYHDLRQHELFVDSREHFTWDQTH